MSGIKAVKALAQRRADKRQVSHEPRQIDSPYLNSAEVIPYLRLQDHASPHSALYRLITEHKLPCGRRGGVYLFDKREIDAWVKNFGSALEQARSQRGVHASHLRGVRATAPMIQKVIAAEGDL